MSICFNAVRPLYCPTCPPEYRTPKNKEPVRCGVVLELVVENYSGTGVDIVQCPICNKRFEVQYDIKVGRLLLLKG
jgi:hypothetical protein